MDLWCGELELISTRGFPSGYDRSYHPQALPHCRQTWLPGYSTIWRAHDQDCHRYVALKIGISDSNSVRREIGRLRALQKWPHSISSWDPALTRHPVLPDILDDFEVTGPNGCHTCYALAPMHDDLREPSFSRISYLPIARALAAKLVLAVAYLHAQGVCHGGNYSH